MNAFEQLARTPLAETIGWALVHSLWEGALAALLLASSLVAVRSARVRYACAGAAMLAVLGGFAVTFYLLASKDGGGATTVIHTIGGAPVLGRPNLPDAPARFQMGEALGWFAPLWMIGVIVFQLRSVTGWMAAQRLRKRGVCIATELWLDRLGDLRTRMRVSKPVTLLETCLGEVPVVIGYLRPMILVPAGMLAGMPAAQMEAILLHELAHVRRHDYLVNLLQRVVEGILFYHPAIWWISSVIRAERENCCDDLAVEASGDARAYAAALAALEQTRWAANEAALAATGGGSLVKRIRRLLYQPEGLTLAPFVSAGILTMVAAATLTAFQANTPAAPKQQAAAAGQPKLSGPWAKWLDQDVVYIIESRERTRFLALHTDEERQSFVEQFWLRRDPTPGTPENEFKEEHYRRIAYANNHYAWGSTPGWKTDRGRIYILYGPPDEIESHPVGRPVEGSSSGANVPYEQWLYRQIKGIGTRVIVEFRDASKTGEYKMTMDPNPGQATKKVVQP